MKQEKIIKTIANKYNAIKFDLDERGKRRWAAAEARSLGWGGITAVSLATGISDRTIRNGLSEIKNVKRLESSRQRKKGAGRNCREIEQPNLIKSLERLIESSTRGDPMSPLRWTCKSTRKLANELNTQGFNVSSSKVASLLKALGYSLQSNKKTVEGKQHPDRNAQFEFIAARIKSKERNSEPAISVDTKKKENIGLYKNQGKVYQKKGKPIKVNTHDFPDKNLGKVVPYGVYDIALNAAGVSIGISHDTAEFAVAAIKRWWKKMGSKKYNSSKKMMITADCGGSNNPKTRLWLLELQSFANMTGMIIEVVHYPPGTSKWNKIEHRLFSHITKNWQGVPLETVEIVINLIGSTRTQEGLEVHAWLDEKEYQKGKKITEQQMLDVYIKRNKFHGEWNYEIHPVL